MLSFKFPQSAKFLSHNFIYSISKLQFKGKFNLLIFIINIILTQVNINTNFYIILPLLTDHLKFQFF